MDRTQVRLQVFGGSCRLVIGGPADRRREWLELAVAELHRVEEKFCFFQPGSVISQLNRAAGTGTRTPLDAEVLSLMQYVAALRSESSQQFDPTIRVLEDCYDNTGRQLASPRQLHDMLSLVGWSQLQIADGQALLPTLGMRANLNSCVRPYAIDNVCKLLLREGATEALVELEGDAATIGRQPDGANWLIGVRHPHGNGSAVSRIKLNGSGYALRGKFEHATVVNGERFGRALSPVDGQPIPGLLGVAVIAENCLTACSAASIARLKTEARGLKWLENLGFPWLAIDRQLHCHGPLVGV